MRVYKIVLNDNTELFAFYSNARLQDITRVLQTNIHDHYHKTIQIGEHCLRCCDIKRVEEVRK